MLRNYLKLMLFTGAVAVFALPGSAESARRISDAHGWMGRDLLNTDHYSIYRKVSKRGRSPAGARNKGKLSHLGSPDLARPANGRLDWLTRNGALEAGARLGRSPQIGGGVDLDLRGSSEESEAPSAPGAFQVRTITPDQPPGHRMSYEPWFTR